MKRCIAIVIIVTLCGCSKRSDDALQGYAEGEYVRIAAPFAGRLQEVTVKRGDTVKTGDPLFVLEQENEAAGRAEAEQRLRNAEARVADLRKARRPPEIEAVRGQLEQARASLKLSDANMQRQQKLLAAKFVSQAAVDEARANYDRDRARVRELEAQVETARLPAREDEIRAAEFNVRAAREVLAQAQWKLAQKSVRAPVAGLVNDTNYVVGEWVAAGSPIVSLLPPQNIKIRFFVPETMLGTVKVGQRVDVRCDGCGAPIAATIVFLSPQAEFTPPVIYSREQRAKLVFMIEARAEPADAVKLHPGQPVDVKPRHE